MLTRCPHCQTTFRVTTEQLKVRQGRVRCGACQSVFDALETLADEPCFVPPPAAEAPPPEEVQAGPSLKPPPEAVPEPPPEPEPEPEPPPEPEPEPADLAPAVLPEIWEAPPPPPRRWPWALGAIALLLAGIVQLLYLFRVELAVAAPELRPLLLAGCELAGCDVPRPRRPELVGIESSDLAPAGEQRLLLTATLQNRAPFAQEYPHLELSLTDTRDAVLVRKVFAPADWLPAGRDAAAGFPARDEVAIRLLLETDVPAVGYRLYLFYP